jgi:putative ABC transport system ATP-binding protein
VIEASGVSLEYNDHGKVVYACRDVSLRIRSGEFIGVLGPSGSGKSSLLYLLSGLKEPTAGRVLFEGKPYSALSERERADLRRKRFGFVFQYPYLIGFLSAIENVIAGAEEISPARERAEALLADMGLGDKMHRLPSELSGGERQRVCVARALLWDPDVVFADEPTASLDAATGREVVRQLVERRRGALVMVTHDPRILSGADRILRIEGGVVREEPVEVATAEQAES